VSSATPRQVVPAKRIGVAVTGTVPAVPAAHPARLVGTAQVARGRLLAVWTPRLAWWLGRTGRAGLAGIALLGASAVFFVSTHGQLAGEVRQLSADLAAARTRDAAKSPASDGSVSSASLQNMPARSEMPQVLTVLLRQADEASLSIDTAKYEISAAKAGSLVRHRLSFPVTGPYTNVRQFLDSTLAAIPELAIDDLSLTRKSITDSTVEAQMRMTIFTRGSP
jgi:Pilus assembly protein, PilO